ncbi:MAG: hypothetical protein QOD29_1383 [Alphaproteobacteria bacterium]|nr:hypothetical protein [Alphaproteobacteria bacterium]
MTLTPSPSWSARSVISAVVIPALVSIPLIVMAQEAIAPYCSDLKRVADLAMTNERFASISAKPRDGNFSESTLALTGWNNCSVYGGRIYTCDSQPTGTAQEAQQAQEKIFHDIQACLGNSWAEAKDRSSLGFIVLHHAEQPVSMTLSRDETDKKEYVVRLILFGRSN